MNARRVLLGVTAAFVSVTFVVVAAAQVTGTALVRHAPSLQSGRIDGSIQQMLGETVTLSGGTVISGDLLVPGTPTVRLNGNPSYGGTSEGTGAAAPSGYEITLAGNVSLRNVVRRTNPVALPTVAPPSAPSGTRNVSLTSAAHSPGDFASVRDLSLAGNAGQLAVPPGSYGDFVASGSSSFSLGTEGSTQPSVYHFQQLALSGQAELRIAGPVVITVARDMTVSGMAGDADHAQSLTLMLHAGDLSLKAGARVYAQIIAPSGTLTLDGNAQLTGSVATDRLVVHGNALLRVLPSRQTPDGSLPYFTDFESGEGYVPGPLADQTGWNASGPVDVVSAASSSGAQSIVLGANLPPAQAWRTFPAYSGQSVVFVDYFAKPAALADPALGVLSQAESARVAFAQAGGQGEVAGFDGDGFGGGRWQMTGFRVPVINEQAVDWLRMTLREDFVAKKWDLFANGRLVAYDLGFADVGATLFNRFAINGHPTAATAFDDFFAGFDHPLFANISKDGVDDAWKTRHGIDTTRNVRNDDPDLDGLANIREYFIGTSPSSADTDADSVADGVEVLQGRNPLKGALPDGSGIVRLKVFQPE